RSRWRSDLRGRVVVRVYADAESTGERVGRYLQGPAIFQTGSAHTTGDDAGRPQGSRRESPGRSTQSSGRLGTGRSDAHTLRPRSISGGSSQITDHARRADDDNRRRKPSVLVWRIRRTVSDRVEQRMLAGADGMAKG